MGRLRKIRHHIGIGNGVSYTAGGMDQKGRTLCGFSAL